MKNSQILKDNSGLASIMFAFFMVVMISLLSLGFAALVRTDQQETADKTLSNQAQYAAETAINRQARILQNNFIASGVISDGEDCPATTTRIVIADMPGVQVTCVKWYSALDKLEYKSVGDVPVSARIVPSNGTIALLDISWSDANSTPRTATYPVGSNLQLNSSNIPTLRVTLAPNNLSSKSIIFLNPTTTTSTIIASSADGTVKSAQCSGSICRARINITGISAGGTGWTNAANNNGLISIKSLNGSSNITIEAFDGGPSKKNLVGAQVRIDATAKSQDVIKRLQANISLTSTTWRPGFAASSDYLCKNYKLDGTVNTASGPADPSVTCQ